MVKVVRRQAPWEKLKRAMRSPFLPVALILLVAAVAIPSVYYYNTLNHDLRSRAAGTPTATIAATPANGTFAVGQQFSVNVVINGNGQAFNAAESDISVSSNLTVNSLALVSPSSGGCNFTFATGASTPTASNPSFSGAILNGSSEVCTLYTLTLTANALGSGGITFNNSSVKAYSDSSEILASAGNGSYTVSAITPAPTIPTTPTPIAPNSDLSMSPASSTVNSGNTFTVQLRVNTNGQMTNAFQTDITYPAALLDVVSVDNTGSAYEIQAVNTSVPGSGTISLASGTITPKTGNLLLNTITFRAKSSGLAQVRYVNPIVASSITNTDVLKSFTSGDYTISSAGPTATLTPTVTLAPTLTAAPTGVSSPTPTSAISIQPPTIDVVPAATYNSAVTLTGTKLANISTILINNSAQNVTFPTATTWRYTGTLTNGNNNFSIVARDASGNTSTPGTLTVALRRIGDINGDNVIDLVDVSMFGTDWRKTGNFTHFLSDMNGDGVVNLTDFSVIAKAYGN